MGKEAKRRAILLFGMPGVGKGTQGAALGALPGFVHVSSGEVFRNLNKLGRLGRQVADYTSAGRLVPDDLTVQIFTQHLTLLENDGAFNPTADLLLLDGIPRTFEQARLLSERGLEVVLIFNLVITNEAEAVARIRNRALKQNRVDDSDEAIIRKRFETFNRQTAETLKAYDPRLTVLIDSARLPVQVLHEMTQQLCVLAHASGWKAKRA